MPVQSYVDMGRELVQEGWGLNRESIDTAIRGSEADRGIEAILAYIATLLEPISEVCQNTLQEQKEKRREARRQRETETRPYRDYIDSLRELVPYKGPGQVLWRIRQIFVRYEYGRIDEMPQREIALLQKPVAEWTADDVGWYYNIGKKTTERFMSEREVIADRKLEI